MVSNIARLSALPSFLRTQTLWGGAFDSRAMLNTNSPSSKNLLFMTGSHRWEISITGATEEVTLEQQAVIDIAQGLLERGAWTLPTWSVEQALAERFQTVFGWAMEEVPASSGALGFAPIRQAPNDQALQNAFVTGRWECEALSPNVTSIWNSIPPADRGSEAEYQFFLEVLVPVLGFPLLDFLRLQPEFGELGIGSTEFFRNRADFALDTGRGTRLIVEIDGSQHDDADQSSHDKARDKALTTADWDVWRIPTSRLEGLDELRKDLKGRISSTKGKLAWGCEQKIAEPRSRALMTCVWGATVVARIQFLILEALRQGILPWDGPWRIGIVEHDTDVAELAAADIRDWFGRLRRLHGFTDVPEIVCDGKEPRLWVEISVIQPRVAPVERHRASLASSRPAQCDGGQYDRRYGRRLLLKTAPDPDLITSFVRDIFRKVSLREGQLEIVSHIPESVSLNALK